MAAPSKTSPASTSAPTASATVPSSMGTSSVSAIGGPPGCGKTESAVLAFYSPDPKQAHLAPRTFGRRESFDSVRRYRIPIEPLHKLNSNVNTLKDLNVALRKEADLRLAGKAKLRPVVVDDFSILVRDWMEERKKLTGKPKFEFDDWEAMNVIVDQIGDALQNLGSFVFITGHMATNKQTLRLEFEAGHGTARRRFLGRVDRQWNVLEDAGRHGPWGWSVNTIYMPQVTSVPPANVKDRYSLAPILPFNAGEILRAWQSEGLIDYPVAVPHPFEDDVERLAEAYATRAKPWADIDNEARDVLGTYAPDAFDRFEIRYRVQAAAAWTYEERPTE